jgi:hypothetical protein
MRSTYLYVPPPSANNAAPTMHLCYLCEGVLKSQPLVADQSRNDPAFQYHCNADTYIHSHHNTHSEPMHDSPAGARYCVHSSLADITVGEPTVIPSHSLESAHNCF